uniref:F-box domain-containing protein n=1 Tax=Strongyloides venezuelensis TaxID=75913 RepID=A0A0K0G321_STRVS
MSFFQNCFKYTYRLTIESNDSTKDPNMEEEHFEEHDDLSLLPDEVLVIILSKLSWKDINKVKFVSKKFYGIIHKMYPRLERRKIHELSIRYNGDCRGYPFFIKIGVIAVENVGSDVFRHCFRTINRFKSVEELSNFLKTADLRNLYKLNIPASGDIDIFVILNKSFKKGTNINSLNIGKLLEKDLDSFQIFIGKLSSVKDIHVKCIRLHSAEAKDVCLILSSLSSLNSNEVSYIRECNWTNILSSDMVIEFFKRSNIEYLFIGTGNIEFVRSLFKEFFKKEKPRKMEEKCGYNQITLRIKFNCDCEFLQDILRNSLSEVKNVVEINTLSSIDSVIRVQCTL